MMHPVFQLGKRQVRIDRRTFTLRSILGKKLTLPTKYSFDTKHPGIPTPMFANDEYGCCVISGRAHQTLRFECQEQGSIIKITDKDVINEYLKETNGIDAGLVMLDSLNCWRRGWKIGRKNYKIKAFASFNPKSKADLQRTVYSDVGAYVGVDLPISAQEEIDSGIPWSKTTGQDTELGSWGGHCVYIVGYDSVGPTCITWGRKQAMTWRWFNKYCVEAYAVIDALNTTKKLKTFDAQAIEDKLSTL